MFFLHYLFLRWRSLYPDAESTLVNLNQYTNKYKVIAWHAGRLSPSLAATHSRICGCLAAGRERAREGKHVTGTMSYRVSGLQSSRGQRIRELMPYWKVCDVNTRVMKGKERMGGGTKTRPRICQGSESRPDVAPPSLRLCVRAFGSGKKKKKKKTGGYRFLNTYVCSGILSVSFPSFLSSLPFASKFSSRCPSGRGLCFRDVGLCLFLDKQSLEVF